MDYIKIFIIFVTITLKTNLMRLKDGFSGERSIVLPQIITQAIERDPLCGQLFITDIGYYPRARHHFRERPDGISQYVFIYCVDGHGWYETGGRRRDVGPDQYFILPADTPHSYGADDKDPWTIYWIHFKGTLAAHYAEGCREPQKVSPNSDSRIFTRTNLFEEIFNTIKGSMTIESIRYAMASFQHYLASLRYLKQFRDAASNGISGVPSEALIHFLQENIGRKISLPEMARYMGLAPSYLSSSFKKATGLTPVNYFNILKIRHACELLDSTDMKLNQISYKIGIEDPYYFSRLFSKIMGMSPRAYRSLPKS